MRRRAERGVKDCYLLQLWLICFGCSGRKKGGTEVLQGRFLQHVCYVGLVSVKSTLDIPNRCIRLSKDFWIVDLGLND